MADNEKKSISDSERFEETQKYIDSKLKKGMEKLESEKESLLLAEASGYLPPKSPSFPPPPSPPPPASSPAQPRAESSRLGIGKGKFYAMVGVLIVASILAVYYVKSSKTPSPALDADTSETLKTIGEFKKKQVELEAKLVSIEQDDARKDKEIADLKAKLDSVSKRPTVPPNSSRPAPTDSQTFPSEIGLSAETIEKLAEKLRPPPPPPPPQEPQKEAKEAQTKKDYTPEELKRMFRERLYGKKK